MAPISPEVFALDVLRHLNIEGGSSSPDYPVVLGMVQASISVVESWCGPIAEIGDQDAPSPPSILHAIRMHTAHLYENREATSFAATAVEMPLGFFDLIGPWRKWSFGS